jgi:hypothetical protein
MIGMLDYFKCACRLLTIYLGLPLHVGELKATRMSGNLPPVWNTNKFWHGTNSPAEAGSESVKLKPLPMRI